VVSTRRAVVALFVRVVVLVFVVVLMRVAPIVALAVVILLVPAAVGSPFGGVIVWNRLRLVAGAVAIAEAVAVPKLVV
jgi:hypothetical protein